MNCSIVPAAARLPIQRHVSPLFPRDARYQDVSSIAGLRQT